jgi:hypothetical protein
MGNEHPLDSGESQPMPTPPLLEQAMREGRNPMEYLLGRRLLGLHLWLVPMRLMPYRGAARMMIGTLMTYKPDDVCDCRTRTIDGEPYWVFGSKRPPRPDKSPFDKLGKRLDARDAKPGTKAKKDKRKKMTKK